MDEDAKPGAGDFKPGERARTLAAAEVLLRLLSHARECFPDQDIDTVTVWLTVASACSSAHMRDRPLLERLAGGPLPQELKRSVSARAVAASTGLPRETVRRKLKALAAAGTLVEDEDGFRTIHDLLGQGRIREFANRILAELEAAPRRIRTFDDR